MPFAIHEERMTDESAKQYALRVLKHNIMRLDMLPGEVINEKDIAAQLQLSRTPVREAILELSKERLVDVFPQKATKVSLMDAKIVEQGRFVRSTIEIAVLEKVCKNCGQLCMHKLEENLAQQKQYVEDNDLLGFFISDNEFHQLLFKAADLDTVYEVFSTYVPHFARERMLRLKMFDTTELFHDHMTIINAIKEHDMRTAQLAMRRHIDRVVCDQKILKEAFPTYFA